MCCSTTRALPSGAPRASEAEVQAWSGQGRVAWVLCFEFLCLTELASCRLCIEDQLEHSLWSPCYTCSVLCQRNLYNRQIGPPRCGTHHQE